MTYALTSTCPDTVILQTLPSGTYDCSHFETVEAVLEDD